MGEAGYKKLIVWQKSNELAKQVYLESRNFPKDEIYGIISQLRRAALSIPTNIVEGHSRRTDKQLKQFLLISLSSLAETEYLLDFSQEIGYLDQENHKRLQSIRQEVGNLLWKFYKSFA